MTLPFCSPSPLVHIPQPKQGSLSLRYRSQFPLARSSSLPFCSTARLPWAHSICPWLAVWCREVLEAKCSGRGKAAELLIPASTAQGLCTAGLWSEATQQHSDRRVVTELSKCSKWPLLILKSTVTGRTQCLSCLFLLLHRSYLPWPRACSTRPFQRVVQQPWACSLTSLTRMHKWVSVVILITSSRTFCTS